MNFSIEDGYKNGFAAANANYVVIWANTVLAFVAIILLAFTIIGVICFPAIVTGLMNSFIRARRGEAVQIGDFFRYGFSKFGSSLALMILFILGYFAGLLLLIIPGIYIAVAWSLCFYLLADDRNELSATECLSKSREMVSQVGWWQMFAYLLIIGILAQLLGFLVIPVFILFPHYYMIYTEAYMMASGEQVESEAGGNPSDDPFSIPDKYKRKIVSDDDSKG